MNRAKALLMEDKKYERVGFQFEHVWPILKDQEKWMDNANIDVITQRGRNNFFDESQSQESPTAKSSSMSSFAVDLNTDEDDFGANFGNTTSSSRPVGRNKEKMKRKQDDEKKKLMEMLQKNSELLESYQANYLGKKEKLIGHFESHAKARDDLARQKLNFRREREETRIMEKDLNSIYDPNEREYWRSRKAEIMENRARHLEMQRSSANNIHGNFNISEQFQGGSSGGINIGFNNFGQFPNMYDGSGDLPDY